MHCDHSSGSFWEPSSDWWWEHSKNLEVEHTKAREITQIGDLKTETGKFQEVSRRPNPTAVRLHFSVNPDMLEQAREQKRTEIKFHDFVRDTSDLKLLRHGIWLLLRVQDTQQNWTLRYVHREGGELESIEVTDEVKILGILRTILFSKEVSCISDLCPNVVVGMSVTRWEISPSLWIDFSSWLRGGTHGMFVVGTLKIAFADLPTLTWEDICAIYPPPLLLVPSKYFVSMLDVAPKAFDTFNLEDKKHGQSIIESYSIIRDGIYDHYHKMTTVADLRALLDSEGSDDTSDEENPIEGDSK